MIKKLMIVLLLLVVVAARAVEMLWIPQMLGDARLGGEISVEHAETASKGLIEVDIPEGGYDELSFTAWVRLSSPVPVSMLNWQQTTAAVVCPEPIVKSGEDLLQGGCGYDVAGGTNLNGAVFYDVELAGYTQLTDRWLNGVYTVAGWASNVITVTVGGEDISAGPGEFNRNVVAGAAPGITVSGAGLAAVGVARCHLHKFFAFIDGVADEGMKFTAGSMITNEIKFVSWRFAVSEDKNNMVYNSDMWSLILDERLSLSQTNALAQGVEQFDGRGIYRIGVQGLGVPPAGVKVEWFDVRFYPWRLNDAELRRVHGNGAQEIERRGIEQWK